MEPAAAADVYPSSSDEHSVSSVIGWCANIKDSDIDLMRKPILASDSSYTNKIYSGSDSNYANTFDEDDTDVSFGVSNNRQEPETPVKTIKHVSRKKKHKSNHRVRKQLFQEGGTEEVNAQKSDLDILIQKSRELFGIPGVENKQTKPTSNDHCIGKSQEKNCATGKGIIMSNNSDPNQKQPTGNDHQITKSQKTNCAKGKGIAKPKNSDSNQTPPPLVVLDTRALDESQHGVVKDFYVDTENRLLCKRWRLCEDGYISVEVWHTDATFIKLRLGDEEAMCIESDDVGLVHSKLCVECNEYRNGSCIASYLPSKVGKQQNKKAIYYTCHTAFIIHAIENNKEQVCLFPLHPINPTNSDANQRPRAWCIERMNVIFLAMHSKKPIAKGDDVHANWRDFYNEKGTYNGLSGFDQALLQTKRKTITVTYKDLFATVHRRIAKTIEGWVTNNPAELNKFTGNNDKITDDIKHVIQNASPESFCPNISKKDIKHFANVCPFFPHGGSQMGKDLLTFKAAEDLLPKKHKNELNGEAEYHETLNMLRDMCLMEEHNINIDRLVGDGNMIPGEMARYLLETKPTNSQNSQHVSRTSMKQILIGYATTECYKGDVYFDYKSWIHVKLFVPNNGAEGTVTDKNKKQYKVSAGVLSLLSICQTIPNTKVAERFVSGRKKILKLAKTLSENFSDLLEENNVHIRGSEDSCVIVDAMSLVVQLKDISARGPTSIQCTPVTGPKKPPRFMAVTALQDDTAPTKIYQLPRQLIGSSLKDLATSLEYIHKQILGDIQKSSDLVDIPNKKFMNGKGAWERQCPLIMSYLQSLLLPLIGEEHPGAWGKLSFGETLFHSGCVHQEPERENQVILSSSLMYNELQDFKNEELRVTNGSDFLFQVCRLYWDEMSPKTRTTLFTWYLLYHIICTVYVPCQSVSYADFPQVLRILQKLDTKVLSSFPPTISHKESWLFHFVTRPGYPRHGTLLPKVIEIVKKAREEASEASKIDDLFIVQAMKTEADNTMPPATRALYNWEVDHTPSLFLANKKRGVSKGEVFGPAKVSRSKQDHQDANSFDYLEMTFTVKVPKDVTKK
jgi:hypothetical protein